MPVLLKKLKNSFKLIIWNESNYEAQAAIFMRQTNCMIFEFHYRGHLNSQ